MDENLVWKIFPQWNATIHKINDVQRDARAALAEGTDIVCVPSVFKTYGDSRVELKRWAEAFCDFNENVENLVLNGKTYTGKPFTKDFPLFISDLTYTDIELKVKPGNDTIKYSLLFFDKDKTNIGFFRHIGLVPSPVPVN